MLIAIVLAGCTSSHAQPAKISQPTVVATVSAPTIVLLKTPTVTPTPTEVPPTSTPVSYDSKPSPKEIQRQLSRTVESGNPHEHFKAAGEAITTSDGSDGLLTAVAAVRQPTADDSGEIVFFWHGDTFLGWDSVYESRRATVKSAGDGKFEVTYADYDRTNEGKPVVVTYAWNGERLVPDASPPAGASTPVSVTLSDAE
ncbi:MAG TPA: LppP/LprE family lipoprotein [Dehalococcoidia bacterium]|nr:LppP/LprE family lipoprotein [Dehalococcoidia bacterium]